MNLTFLHVAFFSLPLTLSANERYWERGCAQQGNYSEDVKELKSQQVMDWNKPTHVHFSAEISCSEKPSFCTMFYYTMRHPIHGAFCPYAHFESVRCAKNDGMIRFNSHFEMSKERGILEAEYETNLEIYHNCDGERVKKFITPIRSIDGRASCQFLHFSLNITGRGSTHYEKDPARRFLFHQRNFHTNSGRFLDGLPMFSGWDGARMMVLPGSDEKIKWKYPIGPCTSDTVFYHDYPKSKMPSK